MTDARYPAPSDQSIVICGYPRAGTTLLYNMIRATVTNFRTFDREISAKGLRERPPWITKDPSDRRHPNLAARRILVVRDARDVLVSTHYKDRSAYKVSWNYTLAGDPAVHLEGLVEIDQQVRALDGVVVRYEEIVRHPQRVQARLEKELGLECEGRFDMFHKSEIPPGLEKQLNGIRPVTRSRVGAWKRHPDRIREQFKACPKLQEILKFWGYEKDERWKSRL